MVIGPHYTRSTGAAQASAALEDDMPDQQHRARGDYHAQQGYAQQQQMRPPAERAGLMSMQMRAERQPRIAVARASQAAEGAQVTLLYLAPATQRQPDPDRRAAQRWIVRAENNDTERQEDHSRQDGQQKTKQGQS